MAHPAILYLGMAGPLSVEPLRWLIEHDHPPHRVAVPAHLLGHAFDARALPVARPVSTCADLARAAGIEVVGVTREWQNRLAEFDSDVLLTACWPWRLPETVLAAFPAAAYNLHPSLLPRYRGPAPLFWQLRAGDNRTGLTLHRLSAAFDSGDIVAQTVHAIADQDTEDSLAQALGRRSGEVLAPWLAGLGGQMDAHPQPAAHSSYQPMPDAEAFTLSLHWEARRAYRFMHGTAARGHPFRIDVGGNVVRARTALGFELGANPTRPSPGGAGSLCLPFADGTVEVRIE